MSAGFDFRGDTFWGGNASIESYLEALADQAVARFGETDPMGGFFRREREEWFTGKVVFLDEVLDTPESCRRFVTLFDAATERLLYEDAFSESGLAWIRGTLGPLRQRVFDASEAG